VEKDQVTIAVTAHGVRAPLGECLIAVFGGRVGDTENLVFLRRQDGALWEMKRKLFAPGPVKAVQADLWSNEVGCAVYDMLATRYGLQGELEVSPGHGT
jgi:hypothetical protein